MIGCLRLTHFVTASWFMLENKFEKHPISNCSPLPETTARACVSVCVCLCVCVCGVCRASVIEESGFIPCQLETSEISNKGAIVIDNTQDQKSREMKRGRRKLKGKKKRKKDMIWTHFTRFCSSSLCGKTRIALHFESRLFSNSTFFSSRTYVWRVLGAGPNFLQISTRDFPFLTKSRISTFALWSKIIKNPDVVLCHSLICSLLCSHRSLVCSLHSGA